MRIIKRLISMAIAFIVILGSSIILTNNALAVEAKIIEEGKKTAFHRKKGNCLACHAIEGGSLPGNIGPPLVNMKDRYPDKSQLRAQIWDATKNNPNTIMPPFGRHAILSEEEIDKIVEFIHTL